MPARLGASAPAYLKARVFSAGTCRSTIGPRLLLRPQIHHAAGFAGGALDVARIADHDLDADADVAADVRAERRRLGRARGFVGVVGPRLDQEPQDVEALLAPKL